ncbi:MAG: hypothetical protein QW212_00705 [Nitrososphaerales archaeon]
MPNLTKQDLRAIARERYSKQFCKRSLLVVLPAVVALIVAVTASPSTDVASILLGIVFLGMLVGMYVTYRWYEKVTREFADNHLGNYWRRDETQS